MMHHSSTPMPRLPPSFTASPTTSATSAPTPTGPAAAPGSGSAGVSSGTLTSDGRIHNSPPSFFPHVPLTQSLNHPGTAGPPGPPGTAPGPGLGLFHSPGSGFGGPSTARRDTLPNPSLSRSPSDSASAAGASGSGTGPGTGTLRREISDFSLLPGPGPIPGSMHAPSMIQDQRKRMSLPGDLLNPLPGAAPPSTADTGPFWEHETGQNGEASGSGSSAGHAGAGSQGRKGRQMDVDMEEEEEEDGKKRKNSATGLNAGLTSCEACRKGKRRCEPSPLVPPSHPDAAKLPCARCRRFALECIRIKVQRRKGPAPVDLSAISDAVHGFAATGPAAPGTGSSSVVPVDPTAAGIPGPSRNPSADLTSYDDRRRSSGLSHEHGFGASSNVRGSGSQPSGQSPAIPILATSPSMNMSLIPDNLDQVCSRAVVNTIIDLFFDYVYPLTPCLHRPTFLAKLAARQDKIDPVFFALTLTVLASTLVQVPRSLVNLDKTEVESLARRCVRVARAKMGFVYEESVPVEVSFIIIAYLEGIVHLVMGNNTAHVLCTASAIQLALAMRLNEELSYEGLDPIDSEIRRRTYWLLFQADKSAACMRARTINLRLEDAASLRLPAEVDDEEITSGGIMVHQGARTPIIAGFNIVTNLFRILNDALLLQRRRAPPTVDSILADLQNVNELREKTIRTTRDVASQLQLKRAMDSRVSSPAHDWEAKLEARFLDFFHSAGDETHTLNSFLVLQGNILVTQSVVRLVLLHSKEALLQQLAVITQMPVQGIGSLAGMQASEPAEDIACELLDGLNSLPVECVATNGPSLVQKVRFVAIQLMECSVSPSPMTARAQKLLMQFLSVLSVIEGMYTFGRDISAE